MVHIIGRQRHDVGGMPFGGAAGSGELCFETGDLDERLLAVMPF